MAIDILGIRFTEAGDDCIKYAFDDLKILLRPRQRLMHKGDNGHVVVIGGDHGFVGAAIMAAEAALRTGAGLVSIATRKQHVSCVTSYRPEIMCHAMEDIGVLQELLVKATTVILGPGLGQSSWARMMFDVALGVNLPTVLDADGLNILSKFGGNLSEQCILTPHPGEAARLIGCSVVDIQNNRVQAIRGLREKYARCVVLKGSNSLILNNQEVPVVCEYGNPGMSSGGTGDVLSGVVGGLLSQGFDIDASSILGVYVHSLAADIAASEYGERGMLATDLMPHIRRLMNPLLLVR